MPDLPSRRRPARPSWSEPIADRLTPAIKAFVIADAILYAFYVFVREVRGPMTAHLALGPGLWHGEVWQLVTSLFVHFDLLGFIFNIIGLWFVGAFIERTQGTRRFVSLFLVSGVLANVALAGIAHLRTYQSGVVFDGCSFAILALFCAFGRIYGRAPTQVFGALTMQARHLAWIFVGLGRGRQPAARRLGPADGDAGRGGGRVSGGGARRVPGGLGDLSDSAPQAALPGPGWRRGPGPAVSEELPELARAAARGAGGLCIPAPATLISGVRQPKSWGSRPKG